MRRARGHERADRERRRNRDGASPRHDLRSDRRPGADPVHRAQRLRRGQGDRRGVAGAAWRRDATGCLWTASSPPCARPAPTCSRNTRRRAWAASRSISSSAEGRPPNLECLGEAPFEDRKGVKFRGWKSLDFLGFFSSESSLFNRLRAIFVGNIFVALLVVRAALAGPARRFALPSIALFPMRPKHSFLKPSAFVR